MENEQTNTAPETAVVAPNPEPIPVPVDAAKLTEEKPKRWFQLNKKQSVILAVVVVVVAASLFFYFSRDRHAPVKKFTNVYSFVPEKISKSAPIQINVPNGIDEQTAQNSITFSPEVAGSWQTEELENTILFKPNEPMRLGVYYAVNMDTGSVKMSGDFYVDEDPQIEAIFPAENSESPEDSEITIVFNRPMVPLTTLTEVESGELPISISPETPGKFKWISTRNLQFIPETTLISASEYMVEIKDGLYSVEGLPIAPVTHHFVTRPLRYEYVSSEQIGYRSPIIIDFNQPVNLEETEKQISVTKQSGDKVAIEVEYGETTYYDYEKRAHVTEPDPSKLFVYQREDTHGRNKLWDFNTTYNVNIAGAVPLAGTQNLTEGRNSAVTVPNIVEDVAAESDRTSLVRPDLLDPQGKLIVTFYEDVNKDASNINIKGLKSLEYGERCKTDESGNPVELGNGCEKEADKRKLILTFKPEAFSTDESFTLELKKIETPDGFNINAEPINIALKTYPNFTILSTKPNNQAGDAALNSLVVCTNTPIKEPGEEGLSSYVQADGYIVYGRWSNSEFIGEGQYTTCKQGEFETDLNYGLLPETNYNVKLSLTDAFGQNTNGQLSFKTEAPKEKYTRFHNLQQQYNVTRPERTKFTYAVENLEYVDMHICRLQPETFLEKLENQVDMYTPPSSAGCTSVINERISLPVRYWVNNYFQVDLAKYFPDTKGQYIITFTNPLYRAESYYGGGGEQQYDRTYVSVTNLAVGQKAVKYNDDNYSRSTNPANKVVVDQAMGSAGNLYWINDSKTLTPVSGASVTQFTKNQDNYFERKTTGTSNYEGIATLPVHQNLTGAVVRLGLDATIVSEWADTMDWSYGTEDASRTYIYTDRPIYRPGHTVHIKGIDRVGFDGSYQIWNKEDIPLQVFDSQGNSVYEVRVPISEYGTFSSDFEIPLDAPLGNYWIEAFGQSSYFSVEEYVPAAFKIETTSNKEEYVDGEDIKLDVQADYYFGVPVDGGTVSYAVTAQDYYFDRYTDEYFSFGAGWYSCYWCGYGDSFLFRGQTTLNENGHAVIERKINFKDYFDNLDEEGSKLVTVSITAKDISGRSVSMQKSFIVHKGEFYLGAKTDQYYTGVNSPVTLRVKSVDTSGKPKSLNGIERKVYKVNWETFKRQEVDGGFYYRSEKKLQEISSEKLETDSNGNWNGPLSFSSEGEYEIHISKTDGGGHKIVTVTNIYIYGSQSVEVPPNNNYELDIEVEKTNLKVGDTATALIKSPYDKAKVLITAERGTVYDYWIADVTGGLYLHQFPIKSGYAPNVFLSALLLSGDPEVKYGQVRFDIGNEQNELEVSVTSNKTHYLPGEEVTLNVETKDHTGQNVPAEVSLAVADLSVLALKGNPKKDPLVFFFDGFPLSVTTASNIKNILYEVDIPLGTKGGGGADPDDLAKKKRGVFKDTAFWQASVVTDQSGKATVTFTLPDNLTTWQIEGLGITKDTKLGVDYSEFTTKKDLMAVPLKPRFVVPGDSFSLGAKVFNQTDKGREVNIKLESGTLKFTGDSEDSVFINQGETKTIYFDVNAPTEMRAGNHTFTFTAISENFVDSVEQNIPITTNTTYETFATSNLTKDDTAVEYIYLPDEVISGEGGLTINANATMAVFMVDALTYMVTYPYGCSEQLASSLSTIGTLTNALSLPNVEGDFDTITHEGVTYTVDEVVNTGLAQIYEAQTLDGGFAYYKGLKGDLYLTLHVATALHDLKEAGYEVKDEVLRRAISFIGSETLRIYALNPEENRETLILAEYIVRQANKVERTPLTSYVEALIEDKGFINEKISSMSLAYLSILTADGYSRSDRAQVYDALQNRIDIDGRGAFLSSGKTANYSYFETSVKNTALLLKAFAAHDDEHETMGNVLNWLLASRDKDGVWGGTHNTFVVIDAMIDYLNWQHETESHFTLKGLLDGVEIFGHEFKPSNIFETFRHFIPTDQIAREKLLPLTFERTNQTNTKSNLYYNMSLKYYLPVEELPPRDEGITITRKLYKLDDAREENALTKVAVGDVVKGKLTVIIPSEYNHVGIEAMVPAGFEIVNFNLETEDQSLNNSEESYEEEWSSLPAAKLGWMTQLGAILGGSQTAQLFGPRGFGGSYGNDTRKLRPTHVESHDDRVFLYTEQLTEGVYEYEYFLRALVPGKFQQLPARAEELFFPEIFGRTDGEIIEITPAE